MHFRFEFIDRIRSLSSSTFLLEDYLFLSENECFRSLQLEMQFNCEDICTARLENDHYYSHVMFLCLQVILILLITKKHEHCACLSISPLKIYSLNFVINSPHFSSKKVNSTPLINATLHKKVRKCNSVHFTYIFFPP